MPCLNTGPVTGFGKLYERIYTQWLAESDYKSAAPYDFERYDKRFISPQHEESVTEYLFQSRSAVAVNKYASPANFCYALL